MTSSASDSGDEFIEMKIDKGSKDASVRSFIVSFNLWKFSLFSLVCCGVV